MHRFHLSEKARGELLDMIHFLLPYCNKLPKTVNKLGRTIGLEKINLKEKTFCPNCKVLVKVFSK